MRRPPLPDLPHTARGPLTHEADTQAAPRRQRELLLFLVLLACGLFVMPLLIWLVGRGILGPYTNGGPFALLVDFFAGLRTGSPVYWAVVFGPYVFVMLLRGVWYLARRERATAG
ncbi:MAG: hypothetical protein IRZ28_02815 [Steroidobacteraceae bacterium]|nr:hypothetical protein [Steroidobacteraceae bacterium]